MTERPTMIKQTRKQLTAWFVLGIMSISLLMSALLFWSVDHQLRSDYERAQQKLTVQRNPESFGPGLGRALNRPDNQWPLIDYGISQSDLFLNELIEFRTNFLVRLIQFNLVVLLLAVLTGYWWSGLSLQPLAQALERERQFSSDVSHELKTPLAALKTAIEVSLKDRTLGKLAKEILKDNLQDVEHLELIVQQLLTLAKTETAKAQGTAQIGRVLSKLKKIHQATAKKKKVKLIFPKKIKATQIVGSQSQLVELLGILLDNAIKFTPKGGKVEIKLKTQRGRLNIIIDDTGLGIDPQALPHIFDRFVKGSISRTRSNQSGLGLGLSIAKQIVETLGGEIYVKTIPGKGSQFVVSLPT